jgi:hypothetical protein
LPEIPPDTAETNALLRNDEIPAFNELNPNKVQTGLLKLMITFDSSFNELIENLSKGEYFAFFLYHMLYFYFNKQKAYFVYLCCLQKNRKK